VGSKVSACHSVSLRLKEPFEILQAVSKIRFSSVPIPVVLFEENEHAAVPFSPIDGTESPASGDVLIVKDMVANTTSYVLSVVPNPGQIRCQTYEQAVSTASRWVSLRQVAIWFSENGTTFTIVSPASGPRPLPSLERPCNAE
jgi:hypothetical protein